MDREIPPMMLLRSWLLEQDRRLIIDSSNHYSRFSIWYPNNINMGSVTLIYPGQGPKESFQYDWQRSDLRYVYHRKVWNIKDPQSFPEILSSAYCARDWNYVPYSEVYNVIEGRLVLVGHRDG